MLDELFEAEFAGGKVSKRREWRVRNSSTLKKRLDIG